jgi:hypothetical protein
MFNDNTVLEDEEPPKDSITPSEQPKKEAEQLDQDEGR